MKKLLELGNHYVSDFIKEDSEMEGRTKYSLDLYLDEDQHRRRKGRHRPVQQVAQGSGHGPRRAVARPQFARFRHAI